MNNGKDQEISKMLEHIIIVIIIIKIMIIIIIIMVRTR